MKKIILTLITTLLIMPNVVRADEGMWFLMFIKRLNERDMQKKGLQLTAEEIYSINNNSLKDAIVQFNGGCTASIISKDGLVLTNHHCGYSNITELSTPENNYLRDGFWAKTKQDELAPRRIFVRFFVRMDNVTDRMLAVLKPEMTEKEREKAINQETAKIQKENNEGGKYVVSVRSFFQGNEFYYFVYQDFSDVRLVGTPPESIGKFGGDTDNWEWPRQTGDFSLFRVYTDKNGNPAPYSPENIPMKAKKHLPVNIGGVQENDFAMIMGYPGRTNRWESSYWVNQKVNYAYPAWVEGSKTAMDAIHKYSSQDEAIRLLYASKYSQIANYWKNRQGMIEALTAHKTAEVKQKVEKKFQKWANKSKNKAEYGDVLSTMSDYFEKTNQKSADDNYLFTFNRSALFFALPANLSPDLEEIAKSSHLDRMQAVHKFQRILPIYDQMSIPVEKEILANMLQLYATKAKNIPEYVEKIKKEYNGNLRGYINDVFQKSIFSSKEKLVAFTENPDEKTLSEDPLLLLSNALLEKFYEKSEDANALQDRYEKAFRKFVKGMRDSKISTILYPDANSTLRLTYGEVKSLPNDTRNEVKKNYYTTFSSLIAKYKPNDPEFDMPKRMIELYEKNDFGRYLDKDGTMHVNFLSNNDITGGNSGSPVMNGKGEVIGLAFDGNIEAMAGDVIFDKKLQRTINVDIRYVLWVIDIFSDAKHIVEEMTIVK
ncbi:MAG: S46 family peptidase [Capnocytophaga sp.]|nr:S46 family peptidase [Capnocytophaga sp.]